MLVIKYYKNIMLLCIEVHITLVIITTISFANSHKIAPVHLPLIGLRTESEDGRLVPLGRRVEQLVEPMVSMVMIMMMLMMNQ